MMKKREVSNISKHNNDSAMTADLLMDETVDGQS